MDGLTYAVIGGIVAGIGNVALVARWSGKVSAKLDGIHHRLDRMNGVVNDKVDEEVCEERVKRLEQAIVGKGKRNAR